MSKNRSDGDVGFTVKEAWAEVLGIPISEISSNSRFTDIGGDSIQGILICASLTEALGVELQLADLYEHDTPAKIADHISCRAGKTTHLIVEISETERFDSADGVDALHFVHSATGEVMFLRQINGLRRGIAGRRVRGIRAPNIGSPSFSASIRGLAALYVSEIANTENRPPTAIAGYSAGAVIALEMASQLAAVGHHVPYLALIDPPGPEEVVGQLPSFEDLVSLRRNELSGLYGAYAVDSNAHVDGPVDESYVVAASVDEAVETWASMCVSLSKHKASPYPWTGVHLYLSREALSKSADYNPVSSSVRQLGQLNSNYARHWIPVLGEKVPVWFSEFRHEDMLHDSSLFDAIANDLGNR